ncbi:YbjQ family protein [Pontibacter indicus]|uniref:Uncharacterized conserved protein YbjQ, UPF0145 family n=1 Tax=Pontibacter indicus TaxID=1317125 RepID=A0A1R3XQ75_9BACT|nr:heavy metal-binding domain-containing protein [Pontibacter indicus]SIT94038.1 Uncharacterized conserved protein YbjQ, UPF0145 family [Pontibacter indicus]
MEQTLPTLTDCPHCNSKLKTGGLIGTNKLVSKKFIPIINEFSGLHHEQYCEKCAQKLYETSKGKFFIERNALDKTIESIIDCVPVISLQSPHKWEYDVLDMVTGQSTTGTGVFSEFKSSFTDFFGMQSGAYNSKISNGENLCLTQLRLKCIQLGGNAVIGADIDYAEVGGDKGMLMVCMTGTAVKIHNTEVLGQERIQSLEKLTKAVERRQYLRSIDVTNNAYVTVEAS